MVSIGSKAVVTHDFSNHGLSIGDVITISRATEKTPDENGRKFVYTAHDSKGHWTKGFKRNEFRVLDGSPTA